MLLPLGHNVGHWPSWSLITHCPLLSSAAQETGHNWTLTQWTLHLTLTAAGQSHAASHLPPPLHSCSSCSSQLLQLSDINHFTTAFTLLLMTAGEVCHERCYQRLWGVSSETAARRQVLLLWLLSLGKNSEVIEWVEQPGGSAQSAVLNLSSAQQQHDHLDQGEAKIVSKNAFHPQSYECCTSSTFN